MLYMLAWVIILINLKTKINNISFELLSLPNYFIETKLVKKCTFSTFVKDRNTHVRRVEFLYSGELDCSPQSYK
jgi:hypothetical protein